MPAAKTPSALREALALHRRGELADAERAYRRLIDDGGASGDAEHMLGLVLHQLGRSEEALDWLERARLHGGSLPLWVNLASALLALGRAAEAESYSLQALSADPSHAGANLNLGLAREAQRRYPEAIDALERAVAADPLNRAALRALGLGDDARVDLLRCEAWIASGMIETAFPVLARLTGIPAYEGQARWLMALAALRERRSDDAIVLLRSVAERHPDHRMAALKLASVELARGDVETALAGIDRWLERHPDDREARSAHLIACQYSRRYDAAALLAEHRRWKPDPAKGSRAGARPHARPRTPGRIGWVSPRFCHGPVEVFFADVLTAMRRDATFEHTLYMTAPAPPETTKRFRRIGATWRDAAYATDGALLDRVREDRIDILVDLAGAGPDNRLAVFAARAAPLQVSWLDYFCTTGLGEIDYLITDDYLAPADSDAHYSEALLRLTPGRLCYTPPPAPAPSTEGVEARRLVCLNRFSKINDDVAAAWSAALLRLPGWSLRLKGTGGDDAGVANALRRRFAAHGVDPKRLDISGEGPYAEAIDAYGDTAVALDPFPFSGCATSFDALWMGLPVVTLPLDTMASRQTGSILSAIGREDWIADDVGTYVDAIVDVARDEDGRRRWRAAARERMRPLTDARSFAREFTAALQRAWDDTATRA
jgi:predicted O-linked N-acetylglucosamine transferase (SPINDLY family)